MNGNQTSGNDAGEHSRYVYVVRPRCPACNSCNVRVYKTRTHEGDIVTRYSICCACEHRFVVVAE